MPVLSGGSEFAVVGRWTHYALKNICGGSAGVWVEDVTIDTDKWRGGTAGVLGREIHRALQTSGTVHTWAKVCCAQVQR